MSEVGRTDRKKREARERIVAAAAGLFIERGARSVSMDEVAEASDVARRTLFNYFESKDELLYAAAAPVLQAAVELAEAKLTEPAPSLKDVVELCLALWESCGRRLGLIYAVELEESPRLAELHARFLGVFRRLLSAAAAADPRYASRGRLAGKIVYRSFVPLLLALDGEEDSGLRFSRGLMALLEGAAGPLNGEAWPPAGPTGAQAGPDRDGGPGGP